MIGETNAIASNKDLQEYNIWTKIVNSLIKQESTSFAVSASYRITSLIVPGTSDNMFFVRAFSESSTYNNEGPYIGFKIESVGVNTTVVPVYRDNLGNTIIGTSSTTVKEGDKIGISIGMQGNRINLSVNNQGINLLPFTSEISFNEQTALKVDETVSASDGVTEFNLTATGAVVWKREDNTLTSIHSFL